MQSSGCRWGADPSWGPARPTSAARARIARHPAYNTPDDHAGVFAPTPRRSNNLRWNETSGWALAQRAHEIAHRHLALRCQQAQDP